MELRHKWKSLLFVIISGIGDCFVLTMNMICLEVTEGELSIFMILSDIGGYLSAQDLDVPNSNDIPHRLQQPRPSGDS